MGVKRGVENINLTGKQLDTLRLLIQRAGKPVAKATFFEEVWHGDFVEEGNLTQTIFMLRKALGKLPDGGEYIETLPRVGYRLSPAALNLDAELTPPVPPVPTQPAVAPAARSATRLQPQELDPPHHIAAAVPFAPTIVEISSDRQHSVWRLVLPLMAVAALILGIALYINWSRARPIITTLVAITDDQLYKPVMGGLFLQNGRILFNEVVDNKTYLALTSVHGGGITRVAPPVSGQLAMGTHPLRNDVLFAPQWEEGMESPLTLMSFPGKTSTQLGGLEGHAAAWSPDGRMVVVARGHELLLSNALGREVHVLARFADVPLWPAWSPDGTRLRFTRRQDVTRQSLWEIRMPDGEPTPLLTGSPHEGQACCGSWSPDGSVYIYVNDRGAHSALWLRSETLLAGLRWGGRERELLTGPFNLWKSPVVTDEGEAFALGEQSRGRLVSLEGPNHSRLQPFPLPLSADTISFSHDGRWIAYTSYPEGSLWRSRADGSDKLELTVQGQATRAPQWSPDDSSILFLCSNSGSPWAMQKVSLHGGASEVLLSDSAGLSSASYSANGSEIAFTRSLELTDSPQHGAAIHVFDVTSRRMHALPAPDTMRKVAYSPGGRYLAAVTFRQRKLMLYDVQQGSWTSLGNEGVNDFVWSRDGTAVFFDRSVGADPVVNRVIVATGVSEQVADLKGLRTTGFSAPHLSISPADQVLVLEDRSDVEVYRMKISTH